MTPDAADTDAERFWEQLYRSRDEAFSGGANALLIEVADPLPPR